jgi:hypothetical protein
MRNYLFSRHISITPVKTSQMAVTSGRTGRTDTTAKGGTTVKLVRDRHSFNIAGMRF